MNHLNESAKLTRDSFDCATFVSIRLTSIFKGHPFRCWGWCCRGISRSIPRPSSSGCRSFSGIDPRSPEPASAHASVAIRANTAARIHQLWTMPHVNAMMMHLINTFRDLASLCSDSAFARDWRRRKMPWYCFALTKTGSSTASDGNGTPACWIPINCRCTWINWDLEQSETSIRTRRQA